MNESLKKFFELSSPIRIGSIVSLPVIMLVLFWAVIARPINNELKDLQAKLDQVKNEVETKTRIVAKLKIYEDEVNQLDAELKHALLELPDKKEMSQLLERVSDKAKAQGLDIKLFQTKPEELKDYYAELPVIIEVGGIYHQIVNFFYDVSRMDRIINISQFAMSEPNQGERDILLKSSFNATAFRFLDEKERPNPDDKKNKKQKGKQAIKK